MKKRIQALAEKFRKRLGEMKANHKTQFAVLSVSCVFILLAAMFVFILQMVPFHFSDSVSMQTVSYTEPEGIQADTLGFAVTAEKESTKGIALDSGFVITCDRDVDAAQLKEAIAISPKTDFTLEKREVGSYYLSAGSFNANQLVTISLVDEQGQNLKTAAFQTEQEFRIESVYPEDGMVEFEPNGGIEVKFTHSDIGLEDFKNNFTLSPAVKGSFEKHGASFCFIPTQPLEGGKTYSATIKAGIVSTVGGALNENRTFSFSVKAPTSVQLFGINGKITETFIPDDNPVVEVWAANGQLANQYAAEIYSYPTAESYAQALRKYAVTGIQNKSSYNNVAEKISTEGLTKYSSYTAKFENIRNSYNDYQFGYAALPDKLPEGWYLVSISSKTPGGIALQIQKFIQISSLSVFSASTQKDITFWINDTITGKSLQNAFISLEGWGLNGNTGTDGVLTLAKNQKSTGQYLLSVKSGSRQYVDLAYDSNAGRVKELRESYITLLYTDRNTYLPSDTVHVWGVVIPKNGAALPPDCKLQLTNDYNAGSSFLKSKSVNISSNGSFTAEIELEDLRSSGYEIVLKSGNATLESRYINVKSYVKPSYVMSLTTDNWFYVDSDTVPVKADIEASFYDGTPAEGLLMTAYLESMGKYTTFKLDKNGQSSILRLSGETYRNGWEPSTQSYIASVAELENTYQYNTSKTLTMFNRNVMLETEYKLESKKPIITLSTHKITTARLTEEPVWTNDQIRGDAIDTDVTVTATRYYTQETEEGTYYDFVHKKSFKKYSYKTIYDTPLIFKVRTKGGKLVFDQLPAREGIYHYNIGFYYKDIKGRDVNMSITVAGNSASENTYEYEKNSLKAYSFKSDTKGKFTLNGTVNLAVIGNDGLEGTGRAMMIANRENAVKVEVSGTAKFSLKPTAEMIPNFSVSGAYFDGKYVYPVSNRQYEYDFTERELKIDIKSDKTKYTNAEMAHLTVTVTKDGKPVNGVNLLISVVDEAAFDVDEYSWSSFELPSSFFRNDGYYSTCTYVSYLQHDMLSIQRGGNIGDVPVNPATAEGGSEGASSYAENGIRKNFVDTAAFVTAVTADGHADVDMLLPDNLTEWRVTVFGYDSTLNGGQAVSNLKVSRDFFVQPLISSQFIDGDDVVFSVRSYGDMAGTNKIKYTFILTGDAKKTKTASGNAKDNTSVSFGKLAQGNYTVTVQGKYGKYSDAVQLPFRVIGCGVEMQQSKTINLQDGLNINATRYPVTVSVYNADYLFYNELVNQMLWSGGRADEDFARAYAIDVVNKITGTEETNDVKQIVYRMVNSGIRPLEYSEVDPVLTARIVAALPEYFSGGMINYFNGLLTNRKTTREQCAAAYMALAALKQPVLFDLRAFAKEQTLSTTERLYVTAGLALIGDTANASAAYDQFIAPNLDSSKDKENNSLVAYDGKNDSLGSHSALSLTAASLLGKPQAEGLARYLFSINGKEDVYCSELINFCKHFRAVNTQKAAFSYVINGKTIEMTLNERESMQITLDKDQLPKANIKVISGNVGATVYYFGSPEAAVNTMSTSLKINKSVSSNGSVLIKVGDLVMITLRIDTSGMTEQASYSIDDYLPTGLRFLSMLEMYDGSNSRVYLNYKEEQRLNFGWYSAYASDGVTITYYAKAVLPGSYTFDSAYVRPNGGTEYAGSQKATIIIE